MMGFYPTALIKIHLLSSVPDASLQPKNPKLRQPPEDQSQARRETLEQDGTAQPWVGRIKAASLAGHGGACL
jgi:hypothetical protein